MRTKIHLISRFLLLLWSVFAVIISILIAANALTNPPAADLYGVFLDIFLILVCLAVWAGLFGFWQITRDNELPAAAPFHQVEPLQHPHGVTTEDETRSSRYMLH